MHSHSLHSVTGAHLNLRSQLLFHEHTRLDTGDPVTSLMSWNLVHAHETSHWVRFHGSSIGILLTLLRASRDALAAYALRNLDPTDLALVEERRSAGVPFFSWHPNGSAYRLGTDTTGHSLQWLALHHTYSILLGTTPLEWSRDHSEQEQDLISMALDLVWEQRAGRGMLPRNPGDVAGVYGFKPLLGGEEPITTRLLLECAGMLDEAYQFRGPHPEIMDPSLRRMWQINWGGPYGEPHRVAERMARRALSHSEVLTLIDFALNPPLPGFHRGVTAVDWREIYPPYRFIFAATVMGERNAYSHSEAITARPESANITAFFNKVSQDTSVRMGMIDSELPTDPTLLETASTRRHFSDRIPGMLLLFASRLQEERTGDVRSISHFGSLWIDTDGIRLLDHEAEDHPWWFFPPLKVMDNGSFEWTSDRLNQDAATDLLIGSAISSAYDDIVHGIGPLSQEHLPPEVFRDPAELRAFNYILRESLRVNISWPE